MGADAVNIRFLAREYAKAGVRSLLGRWNLGIVRDPYESQLIRTLRWLELTFVLDVGANIGQYAHQLYELGYQGEVLSCEPLADAYAVLERRSAGHAGWHVLRTAVGSQEGAASMNVSQNSYSSSVLQVNTTHLAVEPRSCVVGQQEVVLTTVDRLVEERHIDPTHTLLKADVQGYEAALLTGAEETLTSFAAVQLEMSFVPLYDDQALFADLSRRLVSAGFTLHALNPGISDPTTGRLLQVDALFLRDSVLPA